VDGANYCTISQNSTLANLAVLTHMPATRKSSFIGLKEVFVGICVEKGARSFVGKSERNGCVRY